MPSLAKGRHLPGGGTAIVPGIELDNFSGKATFLNWFQYMNDDIVRHIRANKNSQPQVLFLGTAGQVPERAGESDLFSLSGADGTVSFINGKYALPGDGVLCPWRQVPDQGNLLPNQPILYII